MNIKQIIDNLIAETAMLDRTIAALEELESAGPTTGFRHGKSIKSRRRRSPMSPEERLQVSVRMRRYWAQRRAEKSTAASP
jgi:hypothetical protein